MGSWTRSRVASFPFLFGGTFIEGAIARAAGKYDRDFPSFSEGLSLRDSPGRRGHCPSPYFPSFSEGLSLRDYSVTECI